MIVMLADLIPHGSQQVSHRVSFIGPEPPQVWGAHGGGGGRKKNKKKNKTLQVYCPAQMLSMHVELQGCVCVCKPVCRGTEMCILQLVRTTNLPAVSNLTTIGLSAGSFSMRSLTSFKQT